MRFQITTRRMILLVLSIFAMLSGGISSAFTKTTAGRAAIPAEPIKQETQVQTGSTAPLAKANIAEANLTSIKTDTGAAANLYAAKETRNSHAGREANFRNRNAAPAEVSACTEGSAAFAKANARIPNAVPTDAPATCARSVYLTDYDTGTTLYENNADEKRPIASMCKIMTLNLTFDAIDRGEFTLDDEITASEHAASMGGSQAFLRAHENYRVFDLIKSVVVASANDASVALAERVSGSHDAFVSDMNRKAEELGMHDTVFKNCTGLPKPGQFSTARDVSKMLKALLGHADYYRFSGIRLDKINHADGKHTELVNTNKLARSYPGCDGGKTGFTDEAKFCLAATAKRGDLRLISVVIGAEDSKTRFSDSAKLLDYGFANFENVRVLSKTDGQGSVPVRGGKEDAAEVFPACDVFYLKRRGEKAEISTECRLLPVTAPAPCGTEAGQIVVFVNGKETQTVPLVITAAQQKASYFDALKKVAKHFSLLK